jgi:hypothetical protein
MSKRDRQINMKRKFYEISQSKISFKDNININSNKFIPSNKVINNSSFKLKGTFIK